MWTDGFSLPFENWCQRTQHPFLWLLTLKQDLKSQSKNSERVPISLELFKTTPNGQFALWFVIFLIARVTSSASILCTAPATIPAVILTPTYFQHSWAFPYGPSRYPFDHSHQPRLFQFTPVTSHFSPALCLALLNDSRLWRQESTSSTALELPDP